MNVKRIFRRGARAGVATVAVSSLVLSFAVVALAPSASADTAPPAGTPATVSADGLPTWQIDGVVWSQVTVGSTVYAVGSFSYARPPGAAAGSPSQVAAPNIFAYNITTGNPVSFSHSLNAQALAVAASPDGSRVYIGGDFTTVDGQARSHIAAFDTATGALDTAFHPSVGAEVAALAATNTTVYAGGSFGSAGGKTRKNLVAFAASNGAVTSWAPTADNGKVQSMVMAPDQTRVIVGGRFTTLNGVSANGMGALDATTGATLPWAANQTIQDGGTGSAITALRTDGTLIYGSGFAFQTGRFEGTFAADPDTGQIVWLNDCQGDTYDVAPLGQVLYAVSHEHDCQMIGDFPDTNPRVWHHATAFTTYATGTNNGPDMYGWNYSGIPDSTLLHWYPDLAIGSYTKQYQAAWSVTGNSQYVALGGEFPSVNGTSQQGLVRFAVSSIAPNKRGPVSSAAVTPAAVSFAGGSVRVSWSQTWDYDNATLTYNLYRDGGTTPIYSTTSASEFWKLTKMGYIDNGLQPGSKHTYRVKVVDPFNNVFTSAVSNTVTVASGTLGTYANAVMNDGASDYWRLGEPSGTTSYDYVGFNDLTDGSGVGHGASGAIIGDSDGASTFDGTSNGSAATGTTVPAPSSFTIETWIKTTTGSGGKIVGYGDQPTGTSSNYDRHIYMDNAGHIFFGVYPGGVRTVSSSGTYNDGNWHYIVATLGSNGMNLYIDGKRVGSDPSTTTAQSYTGYWRVGGDNLNGWPNQPSSDFFNGTIDEVAIYPTVLTANQVVAHYVDSGRQSPVPPAPTDPYGKAVYGDSPSLYWRLDQTSGPTAVDTSPNGSDGTYTGGVTYGQPGAVPGGDTAVTLDGQSGGVYSNAAVNDPTVYSEELWFKTTTTNGGKLIGFGNQQTGNSSSYDRHVIMLNTGQLQFGVWTGQTNTIVSPASYNDGNWHYLVATQGPDGMNLYVDNQLVGTNPQTQAQPYTGYWRVGGDVTWGGTNSNYFAGTVDEVAIYPQELTAAQVQAHWAAAGGAVTNQPPTASFTASMSGSTVSVDGSASNDPDGTIASYDWNWGDGTAHGSGVTATHTYTNPGSYTITLTVTDNDGATGTATQQVTAVANQPPTASFTDSVNNLAVSVDGSASQDPDGTIASYDWNWGDGTAHGSGVTASHTYTNPGSYTITLTVTDNDGATGTATQQVTVAANQPPTASFTASMSASTVSVDGSASNDPDGTIASYDWNWGDGTAHGSGVTATHTYGSPGPYTVTLTVTDNDAATGTATQQVAAAQAGAVPRPDHVVVVVEENHSETNIIGDTTDAPYINNTLVPEGALMTNSFAETHPSQPNYLAMFSGSTQGVTDDTCPVGPFATDNLAHQLQSSGQTFTAYSEGLPSVDSPVCTSGEYARKHAPWTDFSNVAAGSSQPFSAFPTDYSQLPAVSFVIPNLMDDMHDGTIAQGDTWLKNNLDGYVQWARTHNSLLVLTWDEDDNNDNNQIPTVIVGQHAMAGQYSEHINHYNVLRTIEEAYGLPSIGSATQAAPITDIWGTANQGPTAAFTDTPSGLTVNFDGTGSTDPSGTIQSYDWDFGDNTAHGTGATPQHTYAAAGTYTVTLTVTDNNNATSQVSHNVTVTSGAVVYASDGFGRTVSNGWGNADVGGAWTRVGTASNFSVTNGTGNILMAKAASGPSTYLNSVSSTDTDVQVGFTTDKAPTGTGIYVSVTGRHTTSGDYRATVRLNGTQVQLQLVRVDQNGQANLTPLQTISGLTYTPGMVLQVRVDVTGTSPTTVQAQVWAAGATEPASWQVTATDSSAALQTAGSVGLMSYLAASATNAPVTTQFSQFAAYEADTVPQPAAQPLAMAAMTTTHTSSTPPANQRVSPAFGKSSG